MDFRNRVALVLLALLLAVPGIATANQALREAIAQERARPVPPVLPRAAFLAEPQLREVSLAPDGLHLAWREDRGGRTGLWLQALPDGEPRQLLPRSAASELAWTRDGRWLLLPEPTQLAYLPVAGTSDGGRLSALGGLSRRSFLWPDPTHPAAVLLLERPARMEAGGRWRVLRLDVDGGETVLLDDARQIVDLALAADGRVAWVLYAVDARHELHRHEPQGTTRPVLTCAELRRCQPIGTAPDGGVWLWGHPEGDLSGLFHLSTDGTLRLLMQDPAGEADLADLTVDPQDGRPRLLGWRSTVPRQAALAAADAPRLAALQARFPGRILRVWIGGDTWLVQEQADVLRGARWWLASADGEARAVRADAGHVFAGQPMPRPDEAAMARKLPVRWTASDGRALHGFVHLPPGADPARAPLVVLVHGGPHSLVRPDYSNDAQLLANRGYAVFQPNFRASTGLGRELMFAAQGDFGRGRVLADLVEGTRWLLAEGVGDPARVAIAGASFGGYAALLAATVEPALYQAAIAGVPPTDFGQVMRDYLGSGEEMIPGIPMAVSMRELGADPADAALMQRLRDESPIALAALLQRPVLIVAGGRDDRVPIRGVTHYAARLRTLGKDVTVYIDPDAGHELADPHAREAWYYLMERLLHHRLGGPSPEPPSAALRRHLQQHLRLRGSDFAPTATD
ncbi:MAG: prolyl oligopeptidase family serine peptidase [Xanthomonadales bacterium]|jgi:dipeptidyl aminopeptidase/acylaminoacyl peptidase|nr:prolyl oligopeptidase family serine peptidase [Xanthomonadales bacterium]